MHLQPWQEGFFFQKEPGAHIEEVLTSSVVRRPGDDAVVLADLRGAGESDRPADVSGYKIPSLVADVKGAWTNSRPVLHWACISAHACVPPPSPPMQPQRYADLILAAALPTVCKSAGHPPTPCVPMACRNHGCIEGGQGAHRGPRLGISPGAACFLLCTARTD